MAYDESVIIKEEQLAQTALLENIQANQGTDDSVQHMTRSINEEILLQLKILTKHWEIASGEIITGKDLL